MPDHCDERLARAMKIASVMAGSGAALIGAFYFLSWMSGAMTYLGLSAITMKTNASLCLLLCGIAVVLSGAENAGRVALYATMALAILASAIGGATFLEHITGWDLGIDQILAREQVGGMGIARPNRMGPPGALSFTLCGVAILLVQARSVAAVRMAQLLALSLCLIGSLGFIGYLYRVHGLYGVARYTGIAWQTTIAIILLGFGILFTRPREGIMAVVISNDPGGMAIRRLFLPAIVLPVALGWLRLQAEVHGLFEHNFGTGILVLSWVIIFSIIVFQTGKRLSASVRAERDANEQLQRTQTLLLEAESLSHTGAWEWNLKTDIWTLSDEWRRIHGVSSRHLKPDELLAIAHPEDRQSILDAFDSLRRGTSGYQIEHRIVRQDTGEVRVVKAQGQFVKDWTGRVVRVYGFVQDITEMKRAEEERLQHRQLLESVIMDLPAAVLIARGSDLKVLMINPAYRQFAPGKQMVDRTIPEIWPEIPELPALFHKVLESGVPYFAADEPFSISRGPHQPEETRYFTWSLHRVPLPGNQGFGLLNTAWETTSRKQSEVALRESEQRLKNVIEHLAEGLIVIDPEGGALYWNRKALEMYQYSEQGAEIAFFDFLVDQYELLTLDGQVLPVEDWPIKRIMGRQEYTDYELIVRDRKRNWQRIYSFSGVIIAGLPGDPEMGLLTMRDITARKEAEQALRESEELLRNVTETLPVGVYILDREGKVIAINKVGNEIWGGARFVGVEQFDEYKGWWTKDGKRVAGHEWGGARAIKGETCLNEEIEIEAFDGSHKIILNSAIPIRGAKGEITGAIVVVEDITARKQAEAELRESEEKFRAIFQQAAVGIGRVSFSDARWIDVNDAFCNMLGYTMEELLATPWPEITHPQDVDKDLVPFRQMAAGELENYGVEKRFLHKYGPPIWARLTLSLVRDAQGNPDYEIAIIEDITEKKRAEEALRKANEELELRVRERTKELELAYADLKRETEERVAAVEDLRKNEQLLIQQSRLAAMGEMLGNIAHQWRQPLNILGLLIQQLSISHEEGALTPEQLDQEVAKAMQVILHMSQTINDFKDFLQEDREKKTFSANEAIATTISLFEATLKTMDVQLEIVEKDKISINGHRNEFSQVVMNIITNARDAFRERKTRSPKIVITLFSENGKSVVTIADNAGGIPESIMGKVFDPYFTTKGPDRGTGIGLFMSRNIIEKMNGVLLVRNTAEGAEFRIEVE